MSARWPAIRRGHLNPLGHRVPGRGQGKRLPKNTNKFTRGAPQECRWSSVSVRNPAESTLSLAIIVFSEIHNASLCYRSLQRSPVWSRGTSQRQETLVVRL